MSARIAPVKKVEVPVETPTPVEELTLDQRVAYLEERNAVLEEMVSAANVVAEDPDQHYIVHRVPSYVAVNDVMTLTWKEVRIPLSENEAYEKANGHR